MSPEDLIDFVLGQSDDQHQTRMNERLAHDATLAQRVGHVRQKLQTLLDDGLAPAPPEGLARRACLMVEAKRSRPVLLDYAPSRPTLRWTDFAVAALVFLASILTLAPAVQRAQLAGRTTACTDNLRQIGQAFTRYIMAQRSYPYVSPESEHPFVGAYASLLGRAGGLSKGETLDCPVNGMSEWSHPAISTLGSFPVPELSPPPCVEKGEYAYHMGHLVNNQLQPLPVNLPDRTPILADRPPRDAFGRVLKGNSLNHYGIGQGVLYAGGSVGHLSSPSYNGDSDIYRNSLGVAAPGTSPDDAVLADPRMRVPLFP